MSQDDDQSELDPVTDARVTAALSTLDAVEPPAGFVGQVMWRTRRQAVGGNNRRPTARRSEEGSNMAKKVLIGLVGIAAVGLVIAYVNGFPATSGTEGTIGAAQRYQAEQIKKSDVKVDNPELQAFMQTEAFDKLIHDKQAVAALANPQVAAALANPQIAQALAAPAVQQALAAPEVQQALAAPDFQLALNAQGVQAALASPQLQQALATPEFQQALAVPAFQQAMMSPAFQQAMANPAFQVALSASGLQAALANPQFAQGLAASGFVNQLSLQAQSLAASGLSAAGLTKER